MDKVLQRICYYAPCSAWSAIVSESLSSQNDTGLISSFSCCRRILSFLFILTTANAQLLLQLWDYCGYFNEIAVIYLSVANILVNNRQRSNNQSQTANSHTFSELDYPLGHAFEFPLLFLVHSQLLGARAFLQDYWSNVSKQTRVLVVQKVRYRLGNSTLPIESHPMSVLRNACQDLFLELPYVPCCTTEWHALTTKGVALVPFQDARVTFLKTFALLGRGERLP